jgi:hypothetical protein
MRHLQQSMEGSDAERKDSLCLPALFQSARENYREYDTETGLRKSWVQNCSLWIGSAQWQIWAFDSSRGRALNKSSTGMGHVRRKGGACCRRLIIEVGVSTSFYTNICIGTSVPKRHPMSMTVTPQMRIVAPRDIQGDVVQRSIESLSLACVVP